MKTLDEVIKAFEATFENDPVAWEYGLDALHYLKEYREVRQHLACMNSGEIRGDATQIVNNPALSWNELKQMEGKPVWVEYDGKGRWRIISKVSDSHLILENQVIPLHKCWINESDGWQAYRKERE